MGTTNANGQPSLTFTTFEASWQNLIGKWAETSYQVKVNGDFKDYHLSDVKDAKVLDEGNRTHAQPVQGELGFSAEDRSSLSEILYLLELSRELRHRVPTPAPERGLGILRLAPWSLLSPILCVLNSGANGVGVMILAPYLTRTRMCALMGPNTTVRFVILVGANRQTQANEFPSGVTKAWGPCNFLRHQPGNSTGGEGGEGPQPRLPDRRALTVGGNMKRRVWIQKGFPWFSVPIALLEDTAALSVSDVTPCCSRAWSIC